MSIEELYRIIIEKRKNAIIELKTKSIMSFTNAPEELTLALERSKSELKGCIEAYEDLICLIAEKNNFTLPNFNCCEE